MNLPTKENGCERSAMEKVDSNKGPGIINIFHLEFEGTFKYPSGAIYDGDYKDGLRVI